MASADLAGRLELPGPLQERPSLAAEAAQVDDGRQGQGRAGPVGRVDRGIGGSLPVQAHAGQFAADRPQVPDVHGRAFGGGHDQARSVGAEDRPYHAVRVGTLEPGDRAARLGLDQAEDLVRILDGQQAAVGGEAETRRRRSGAPRARWRAPRAGRETSASSAILPSGLKATRGAIIDRQLGHLVGDRVADAPDLGAAMHGCRSPAIPRRG